MDKDWRTILFPFFMSLTTLLTIITLYYFVKTFNNILFWFSLKPWVVGSVIAGATIILASYFLYFDYRMTMKLLELEEEDDFEKEVNKAIEKLIREGTLGIEPKKGDGNESGENRGIL